MKVFWARTGELRWALGLGLVAVLTANLPYAVGYASQTAEATYSGVAVAPGDNLSYLAAIGQGWRGNWLYQLPHTSCFHRGIPVYTYYLLLGHFARLVSLPAQAMLHLSRLVGGFVLMLVVYFFVRRISGEGPTRRLSYLLIGFSSGVGWLMLPLGLLHSTDLTVPESNTFFTLMDNAHFPVSQALLLLYWLALLAAQQREGRGAWTVAAAGALCLGLVANIQPFMLAIALPVSGLYVLCLWLRDRRLPRFAMGQGLAAALVAVPVLAYMTTSMQADPLGREWLRQNLNLSPPPWYFLSGYGLLLPAAAIGARRAFRRRGDADLLLLIWVAVTAVALYAPTAVQRRFSLGLHIPIAALAAWGVHSALISKVRIQRHWLIERLFVLVSMPTSLLLVLLYAGGALSHSPTLFLLGGEREALAWLDRHSEPGVAVLASPELGVFVPAFTSLRSVSGNEYTTPRSQETEAMVRRFFSAGISSGERQRMLEQFGVQFVLLGPRERAYGIEDLTEADGLSLVARFRDVLLFETPGGPSPAGAQPAVCPP